MYTNDNYSCKELSTISEKYGLGGTAVTDCLVAARNNLGNKALDCCLSEAAKSGQLAKLSNCSAADFETLLGQVAAGAAGVTLPIAYTEAAAKELGDALSAVLKTYRSGGKVLGEFTDDVSTALHGDKIANDNLFGTVESNARNPKTEAIK